MHLRKGEKMARLIRAVDLMKRTDRYPPYISDTVRKELRYVPTVDAVEVIRCKDCVFFHRYGFKLEYTECRRFDCHAPKDGYCCWAERKEDETG